MAKPMAVVAGASSASDLRSFERGGQARMIFRTIFAVDEKSEYACNSLCLCPLSNSNAIVFIFVGMLLHTKCKILCVVMNSQALWGTCMSHVHCVVWCCIA